jgi:hypothetical protein
MKQGYEEEDNSYFLTVSRTCPYIFLFQGFSTCKLIDIFYIQAVRKLQTMYWILNVNFIYNLQRWLIDPFLKIRYEGTEENKKLTFQKQRWFSLQSHKKKEVIVIKNLKLTKWISQTKKKSQVLNCVIEKLKTHHLLEASFLTLTHDKK